MTAYEEIMNALRLYYGEDGDVLTDESVYEIIGQAHEPLGTVAKALDEYRASNSSELPDGWTHFAERLPDVGTTNIIYGNLPASSTKYAVCEYGKYGFDRSCVTHWMPLPPPPKQEK